MAIFDKETGERIDVAPPPVDRAANIAALKAALEKEQAAAKIEAEAEAAAKAKQPEPTEANKAGSRR